MSLSVRVKSTPFHKPFLGLRGECPEDPLWYRVFTDRI